MRDSHPASKLTGREVPRLLSLTVGFHRTAVRLWRLLIESSMPRAGHYIERLMVPQAFERSEDGTYVIGSCGGRPRLKPDAVAAFEREDFSCFVWRRDFKA
jgi:hypothetical protein